MVAKISYGSSIYGAVSYNHVKVEEGTARIIHTHNMIRNLSADESISIAQTLDSFEDYIAANTKVKSPVAHFSLNPSPGDTLSDQDYMELADQYMHKMGYGEQPYIVYKHEDIQRGHIHIVSVRIDENGKKISDIHDFKQSMDACRELEVHFGLQQLNDQERTQSAYYLRKVTYEKGDVKRQIANTVKSLLKDYRFQSFGEFNALLSCYNIHCRQVKGEEKGNLYHGIIYQATKDNGELIGSPIKSSRIGKMVGYEALNKRLNKTAETMKVQGFHVPHAKSTITGAMQQSKTKEQFIATLKSKQIDTVFRENDQGRIYGVTFIDHSHKIAYNGSRLGKEFSATVFNKLFGEQLHPSNKEPLTGTGNTFEMSSNYESSSYHPPASVDEIFGTFFLDHSAYNAEEEAFIRRMKRRKKKRKGFGL